MTDSMKVHEETTEEKFRKLFDRTAKISDHVAALLAPAWGSELGIIPADHPLYVGEQPARARMTTEPGTPPSGPAGASTLSIHAGDVAGFCPACGHGVLMLGDGGHVTCTLIDCPNPGAADQLLHGEELVVAAAATGAIEAPAYGPAEWTPDHYRGDGLQPFDVINAFDLDFYEGNAIKYLLRWRKKNGAQDLRKARTYVQILIDRAEAGEPQPDPVLVVHHVAAPQTTPLDGVDENGPELDACRPVDIGGETIRVHGSGQMSAASREALGAIVDAARRQFEQEHPPYDVDDPERRERYAQALYVTLEVTPRRHPWETLSPLRRVVWYQRAEAAMAMADVELAAVAAQDKAAIERVREALTYAEQIIATTGPGPASAVQAVLDRLRTALDETKEH